MSELTRYEIVAHDYIDFHKKGRLCLYKDAVELIEKLEQENKRLAEREIKSREEAARFIENQLDFDSDYKCKREKNWCHHYGWQELRELMDFIYEGEPKSKEECLINACEYRKC